MTSLTLASYEFYKNKNPILLELFLKEHNEDIPPEFDEFFKDNFWELLA